jgi:phosphoglycerol transferase MdoB-like AlkP superfamily enzyme
MYRVYHYLSKLFLFWLIFFAVNRIFFLIVQVSELQRSSFGDMLAGFYYALPLDVSATCYSCAFPFIVVWIAFLSGKQVWLVALKVLVIIIIFIQCAIAYGDAALYTQWHTKLSWKALAHFAHPSEVFKTATWGLTILFFAATILFGILYTWVYRRFIHLYSLSPLPALRKRIWPGIFIFPAIGFIIFSGIRGGWKRFPISLSIAYYSPQAVMNDAAVNPSWFLIHDISHEAMDINVNPYHWMPPETATRIVDSLFSYRRDTTISVLTDNRSNIVLFILESWPRDAVQVPGHPEITPVFDSLIRQGIYFDRCFATGYVSDEGIPGILSAFPTSANVSVLTEPQKTIHLPAINEILDSAGYHSGFIYGGQLDFGNIQSYVYNKKFTVVKSGRDFPVTLHRGALGIPDDIMAGYAADMISEAPQPFFYCWYTLSTHPPYDIPAEQWIRYGGIQMPFINTIHYSDSSLGLFFRKIKTQPWYKHTLFIFVSDHSHDSQYQRPIQDRDRNSIPLLFYGDVIKPEWRGKVIHRITSQLDIAATLLAQMQIPHTAFPWSKNAFNPYAPQFAAINYLTGSGFITPEGFVSLDDHFPDFILTDLKDSTEIRKLKRLNHAYEQAAYEYFLRW